MAFAVNVLNAVSLIFPNPRTGQTVLIPDDITLSFAHNHGDRLGAMDALFGERNGEEALAAMIAEREAWLDKRYSVPSDKVAVLALPDKVSEKEVRRLTKEQSANNTKNHEARAAAAWQAETGDRLEVFDLPVEKGKGQHPHQNQIVRRAAGCPGDRCRQGAYF